MVKSFLIGFTEDCTVSMVVKHLNKFVKDGYGNEQLIKLDFYKPCCFPADAKVKKELHIVFGEEPVEEEDEEEEEE